MKRNITCIGVSCEEWRLAQSYRACPREETTPVKEAWSCGWYSTVERWRGGVEHVGDLGRMVL